MPQLEEEVRRLGNLTEEREKHCRYATKALELLPSEYQGILLGYSFASAMHFSSLADALRYFRRSVGVSLSRLQSLYELSGKFTRTFVLIGSRYSTHNIPAWRYGVACCCVISLGN